MRGTRGEIWAGKKEKKVRKYIKRKKNRKERKIQVHCKRERGELKKREN